MKNVKKHQNLIEDALDEFIINTIEPFLESDDFENLTSNLTELITTIQSNIQSNDWEGLIKNYNENSKIVEQIEQEFKNRNLLHVLDEFNLEEGVELYFKAGYLGLSLGDLIDDIMNLYSDFNYKKAITYLSLLQKRYLYLKNSNVGTIENINEILLQLKAVNFKILKRTIMRYEVGEIKLTENQIMAMRLIKQNNTNQEIANKLSFSLSRVEKMLGEIRVKFNIDYIENNHCKRLLMKNIASLIA